MEVDKCLKFIIPQFLHDGVCKIMQFYKISKSYIMKKTGFSQSKYAHCVISKKVLLLLVVYGTIIMHNFRKSLASMSR